MLALSGLFYAARGLWHLPARTGWLELLAGLALGTTGYGLYRCWAWMRWPGALVLALGCALELAHRASAGAELVPALRAILLALAAAHLALPSTGAFFAAADTGGAPTEPGPPRPTD